MNWFEVQNASVLETPAMLVYPDRVKYNIERAISMVGTISRLRPHVKTNKSADACRLMIKAGIKKFKCATIAEAEMLGGIQAADVLLAYQPVGPAISRLKSLVRQFPETRFSCLIDNAETAAEISTAFEDLGSPLTVYIDLNVGMNRTGIIPDLAYKLYEDCKSLGGIELAGFHAYEGHIHEADYTVREEAIAAAFRPVTDLIARIRTGGGDEPILIAGGTPGFPIHAGLNDRECSPGTFIYWDHGYQLKFTEQSFLPAAVLATRIISKPAPGIICTDLGYKAVSAENELSKRLVFLNLSDYTILSQSEEHLALAVANSEDLPIGTLLYALPWHVCPSVALYDALITVENQEIKGRWPTSARNRKISV